MFVLFLIKGKTNHWISTFELSDTLKMHLCWLHNQLPRWSIYWKRHKAFVYKSVVPLWSACCLSVPSATLAFQADCEGDAEVLLHRCSVFSQETQGHRGEEYNVCTVDAAFQSWSNRKFIALIQKSSGSVRQPIGYHDNRSGRAAAGALRPVAQHRPAFHAWEYRESVWDARQWRQDSAALQTGMDVESILSAGGIRRKWPSIRRQGNVPLPIVCRVITDGLARPSSVWCNWLKTNGLPGSRLLTGAIGYTWNALFYSLYVLGFSFSRPSLNKKQHTNVLWKITVFSWG